ncbi:MAG: hypothetical protein IPK93_02725 [Solirubrobacterales bacterium]|nr:hypothetical protein [Solirubrobacterales bacterium]
MKTTIKLLTTLVSAALTLCVLLPSTASAGSPIKLEILSSKPNRVTGGDALVAVTIPDRVSPAKTNVRLNGKSVKSSLSPDSGNPRRLTGVVSGFRSGSNRLSAWARSLNSPANLEVFNSPITGPVFSGPHQTPFICRTAESDLGEPLDENCSANRKTEYFYRTTGGDFKPLADPAQKPGDLAQTTTSDGRTVDYIVRVESGTVNRAMYRWAILVPGGDPQAGWNDRLVFKHGGGCTAGHQQGIANVEQVLQNDYLKRGFSVVTSSLTNFQTACNDVLSAETVSMLKEYVIEKLGRAPDWTIGDGASGGSMQVQLNTQNYPGLFDGIIPSASFPDNVTPPQPDCRLLYRYFDSAAATGLTGAERVAITGIINEQACIALGSNTGDVLDASEGCANPVPSELIFDPITNPGGIRCSLMESMVNTYGRDPATGYARSPIDNVGTQYGLEALAEGKISLNEFLDLNKLVGGFDVNGDFRAERSVGDPEALETIYKTGRINRGGGGNPGTPIIDVRRYADDRPNVHIFLPSYMMRARIRATNGGSPNHVMFRASGPVNNRAMEDAAIDTMSAWLDAIKADDSNASLPEKVAKNRPADAVDACWAGDGQRTDDPAEIGATGPCTTLYPPHSLPQQRAGKPLASLVYKCQLKPVNAADYGSPNPAQVVRLNQIFPSGVCDYSKPGVGEQPLKGTDISFGPEQTVEFRKRKLFMKTSKRRVHRSKRGGRVKLTATLYPCPAVTWQRVIFERKVRKGNQGQEDQEEHPSPRPGRKDQRLLPGLRQAKDGQGGPQEAPEEEAEEAARPLVGGGTFRLRFAALWLHE